MKKIIIFIFICILFSKQIKNFPLEPSNKSDNNFNSETHLCIQVCLECFQTDANNDSNNLVKNNQNFFFFNNLIFHVLFQTKFENSKVLQCVNQCIITSNPIKSFIKWWEQQPVDFDVTVCLLDFGLKYNL